MQPIKRFIAGVVCPKCGASDSVRAWHNDEEARQYRECVDCGYEDSLSTSVQVNPPSELTTRVNQPDSGATTQAQPVKILDPGVRRTDH